MNIVWVSLPTLRYPLKSQVQALEFLFPESTLHVVEKPLHNAEEVLKMYRELKGNELVLIAPLTVVRTMINRGIRPLQPLMEPVPTGDPRTEIEERGKSYRFNRFRRINSVKIEYCEVVPAHLARKE